MWNKSKFKQGPDVRYLKDEEALLDILEVLIRDKAKEHLAKKLFTKAMEEFKKAMEKFKTENFSEIFSRTPALFTFTPKYGGPKVNNEINNKIHFLVFHLTSSNPKSGGRLRTRKRWRCFCGWQATFGTRGVVSSFLAITTQGNAIQ